ncbi:MAG TPA: potassium transporter TrkG [bacterium]|jgi:trk system potassium uptake protein TrkH|nr:MAG: Trk system potassium uptake protein TrkH [bacterium ADurb.Bin270]HPW45838.1 potassium transporter TrkG [bacterium]
MRARLVIGAISKLNFFIGLTMLAPLVLAWADGGRDAKAIATSMMIILFISGVMVAACRGEKQDISHKEGMLIVAVGWISVGLFGALPYFVGQIFGAMSAENFINSFFESISGFTTTGASVFGTSVHVESLSRAILLWRSQTHWLGGMGIIVLVVAILPLLGVGGMQLFRAESPGPTKEKLRPRIRQTAATLWLVYLVLTIAQIVALLLAGMPLFDSICHTFATVATGGFSIKNISIEAYNSATIDGIITFFMFIAAVNFSLHYMFIFKRLKGYWANSEFRYYFTITIINIVLISAILFGSGIYDSALSALRYGSFQTVSVMTTTGFSTADFEKWPIVAQILLLIFMFLGGCSGSTSGSIKIARIVVLAKHAYRELFRLIHPRSFATIKFGGKVVHKDILESISGFFILYMGIFTVASIFMTAIGLDLLTAITSVATMIGNVGPGLGAVGPSENYFMIPSIGKIILIMCMLLGRLEIFTVIVLMTREFWKR